MLTNLLLCHMETWLCGYITVSSFIRVCILNTTWLQNDTDDDTDDDQDDNTDENYDEAT